METKHKLDSPAMAEVWCVPETTGGTQEGPESQGTERENRSEHVEWWLLIVGKNVKLKEDDVPCFQADHWV